MHGNRQMLRTIALALCLFSGMFALAQDSAAPENQPADSAQTQKTTQPSPLVGEPATPEELFDATLLMVNVARPDLARRYLDKLLEAELTDELLLSLREKHGSGAFLRLTGVKQLQPAADNFLEKANAAFARAAVDPERIGKMIAALGGTDQEQATALADLRGIGAPAVPLLLAALENPAHADREELILLGIARIGEDAVPPLLAALESPGEILRAQAATALGMIQSPQAIPYLWYPALAGDEPLTVRTAARQALARILNEPVTAMDKLASDGTATRLLRTAAEHFRGKHVWKTNDDGLVPLWKWDPQQKLVVPAATSAEAASDRVGLRFAAQALKLAADQRRIQALYLALALANAMRETGVDQPIATGPGTVHDLALSIGPEVVAETLRESLSAGRSAPALAALRILEQVGTVAELKGKGSKPSSLVTALNYPDARVQFAAAGAVLQIDPPAPFSGSSRVVQILERSLSSDGKPHALVGEVSAERGARVGGYLAELGYEPLLATSGRDVFKMAADRTDVELIVLHPNIIRWALTETLANLRADARTASIPIIIHGPADLRPKMRQHLHNYNAITFASQSETTADFELQGGAFIKQTRAAPLTPEERAAQKETAVAWLAHIAEGRRTRVFNLAAAESALVRSLADEQLVSGSLTALAEIASRTAQVQLAQSVLDTQLPLPARESAAAKLAFHIQRFGLTISKSLVEDLRKAWDDPQTPPGLHTALGSVIGSLKPDAARVGSTLKSFQPPADAP
jgi:hypothetical protein